MTSPAGSLRRCRHVGRSAPTGAASRLRRRDLTSPNVPSCQGRRRALLRLPALVAESFQPALRVTPFVSGEQRHRSVTWSANEVVLVEKDQELVSGQER